MDPVSRLGRMIVAMRSATAAAAAPAQAVATSPPATPETAREHLRRRIAQRLQAVDLGTLPGRRQGVRTFLQTTLLQELGEPLMQSPRFIEMLGEIQDTIESDVQVHGDLVALLHDLKEGR